ncbi:MAG: hypothetical protein ABW179_07765, partial [Methylobacterium sp.]
SSGIRLTLASADVSLADGRMTGTGPVDITTPNQRLEAGNVVVSQGGKAVSFRDRVKLTLLPNTPAGSSPASSQAPAPSQATGAEPLSSEPSP